VSPHAKPYVVFVGSVKPHKNLVRLLEAFGQVLSAIPHDLVIAGSWKGQRAVDRKALAAAARMGDRVRVVESPGDAELARFMAHATALVLPSTYEGFGLPAIEAMAARCACIVSRAGSLPEVCGDAALFCDPMDPADIARQIVRVVNDDALRARLVDAGARHAAQFDWNVTASRTSDAIQRVLDELQ
jgi:glycosyltransferase involved in cell wall biosynthesis